MGEEGDWRERARGREQKTKGLLSSPYRLSSAAYSQSVPISLHEPENPLCIIHKGIINDSSGTTLEELRESLEILFLSGYASVGDVRPSNPCR